MINIKRGDTFAFYANITDELGQPLITDIANLKSQIRDRNYVLVETLAIATTEIEGQYLFTAADTNTWFVQRYGSRSLIMDIEMSTGGVISSSDTIDIEVTKDVTYSE